MFTRLIEFFRKRREAKAKRVAARKLADQISKAGRRVK